jgi:hypothetical protein
LGWLGVPITVLWLLACINALNLLDGMDGLASLVGLCTAAMLAIIALNLGHAHVAIVAFALAGALAGFLLYNLPPASIYLGDSGSMVIGMVIGLLGMQAALKTPATLAITAPAVLMSIPMLDTVLAIIRRKLNGQHIATADRGHIHHRLLERGLSNWQALGVIGLLCLLTGGAAITAIWLRSDGLAWALALSLVVILVRLRVFGHHELALGKLTVRTALVRLVERTLSCLPGWLVWPSPKIELTFESAWPSLIEQLRPFATISLELTCSQGTAICRHTWQQLDTPRETAGEWSLSVSFHEAAGQSCQARLVGRPRQPNEVWRQSRAAQLLTVFCQHWSQHAAQIPSSQHWSDGPDGRPVGMAAELSVRAKAA